jgi:hypothetical protein
VAMVAAADLFIRLSIRWQAVPARLSTGSLNG